MFKLLLFATLYIISMAIRCIDFCWCDVTSMNCSNTGIVSFPLTLPSHIKTIDLNSNHLHSLTTLDAVKSATAENLEYMDISNNTIHLIDEMWLLQFPSIRTLNLTRNKISSFNFRLPKTIQILQLSHNLLHVVHIAKLEPYSTLRELYLEHNYITKVNAANFSRSTLNIEVINLRHNKIDVIEKRTFYGMKCLKRLLLSHNQIRSLDRDVFQENDRLTVVDLSYNSIADIDEGIFKNLEELVFLSISNNKLVKFPDKLPILQWFDVSFNFIVTITENQGKDLLPHDVTLLGGNPLNCDCEIQWLKDFLETRQYLLKYIEVEEDKFEPICGNPVELRGRKWNTIDSDMFICKTFTTKSSVAPSSTSNRNMNFLASLTAHNYIKLQWDKTIDEIDSLEYKIHFHPFGNKNLERTVEVDNLVGRYTMRDLEYNTPYVICLRAVYKDSMQYADECIEVRTTSVHQQDENRFITYLFWTCICTAFICVASYFIDTVLFLKLFMSKFYGKHKKIQ